MSDIEAKLAQLGYQLPPPPDPVGNYLPITRSGNVSYGWPESARGWPTDGASRGSWGPT